MNDIRGLASFLCQMSIVSNLVNDTCQLVSREVSWPWKMWEVLIGSKLMEAKRSQEILYIGSMQQSPFEHVLEERWRERTKLDNYHTNLKMF